MLPDAIQPACWSDDTRMNALFAPFREKSVNPHSWDMKMKFWKDLVKQYCLHKNDPRISIHEAKVAFQRGNRAPSCLNIVFEDALRNGELVPPGQYALANAEGWVSWGARQALRPAAFAVGMLSSLLGPKLDKDGLPTASVDVDSVYVVESVLEEMSKKLLLTYEGLERFGTIEQLMQRTGYRPEQLDVFRLVVGYLFRNRLATRTGDVIKLAHPDMKVTPLTESEQALHELITTESRLNGELLRLQREEAKALADAKLAMKAGDKIAAKNHLRQKHKCWKRIETTESAVENVRQLIHNIRDADTTAAVVGTYKASADAMRNSMRGSGISEDSVHQTMDELKEVLEEHQEIENTLAGTLTDVDNEELEEELAELLRSPDGPPGGGREADRSRREKEAAFKGRLDSESSFVFDGEERILQELNNLSVQDSSLAEDKEATTKDKIALPVTTEDKVEKPKSQSARRPQSPAPRTKNWYPPEDKTLQPSEASKDLWNEDIWHDTEGGGAGGPREPWSLPGLDRLASVDAFDRVSEIRLDGRIHPGQKLDLTRDAGPILYTTDFEVQDHRQEDGVWLFNSRDNSATDFGNSTEYSDSGDVTSDTRFKMAPGSERTAPHEVWKNPDQGIEDLERRLNNLRKF